MRQLHAIGTTSIGALATFLAGAPMTAQAQETTGHPAPNWESRTSSANDVGCIKTIVTRPQDPGLHAFLFSRPPGLDIATLSDEELSSCGLPSRGRIQGRSKDSSEYRAWLAEARARLAATQVLPWGEAPLRPDYVPPPSPTVVPGRPEMIPLAGPPPFSPNHTHPVHEETQHSDLGSTPHLGIAGK